MHLISRDDIQPYVGDDGAIIPELASPGNSRLTRHSVAEIRHPPGTASLEHYHMEAEEVWDAISWVQDRPAGLLTTQDTDPYTFAALLSGLPQTSCNDEASSSLATTPQQPIGS